MLHLCARVLAKLCDDAELTDDAMELRKLLVIVNQPVDAPGTRSPLPGTLIPAPQIEPDRDHTEKPRPRKMIVAPTAADYDSNPAPDIMKMVETNAALEKLARKENVR